ncbi:MAG TPA: substrate-binding domain-containing protein [Candidatus Udaeobacter sp.]|nr:substrate-binding domain-containing protein [Candidatus Udaeobacter sp.]
MWQRCLSLPAFTLWLLTMVLPISLNAAEQRLIIGGAQSLIPLAEKYSREFHANHPGIEIEIRRANSNYAIDAVRNGEIQLGLVARRIGARERSELKVAPLGHDAIILLSYPWNSVANLTLEQLRQIYLGKITSWKEVGGEEQGIVPFTREASSALHKMFLESVFGKGFSHHEKAFILRANKDKVLRTIKRIRGSLGYGIVRLDEAQAEGVTVMAIDGKFPSAANIRQEIYPLIRPQLLICKRGSDGVVEEWRIGFEKFVSRNVQAESR